VCGSWSLAEEAVQEAVARAWERSERGQHIDSPPAWVATVAGNLLRDGFRRFMVERQVHRRLGERAERAAAESGLADVERGVDVAKALAALPRRQREVAVYRYYLDLEVGEIALRMGIPEGTVKSTLHRARHSLAQTLADNETREVTDVRG
jgi:RNA polymerase sigma-70 factor, ECF subfamily